MAISDFIIRNDHYPKANRKNADEEKLYHALARIRRAKEKGKLLDEQLALLKEYNIIFERTDFRTSLGIEEVTKLIKENQILKASQLYLKYSYDSGVKDYKFIEKSFEKLVEETFSI